MRDDFPVLGFALATIFFAFLLGIAVGACVMSSVERDRAIKAGVGRYVVDPNIGNTNFVYGTGKE